MRFNLPWLMREPEPDHIPIKPVTFEDIFDVFKSQIDKINAEQPVQEPLMSTPATPATPKSSDELLTFLQHAGVVLKNILHIGEAVASVAEPIVDLAFPDVAPLYNSALGLAMSAQATAPSLTGTGPQKLAQLTANLIPQAEAWAQQNGITWNNADITKWASAVVDTLNMIPGPTTVAAVAK